MALRRRVGLGVARVGISTADYFSDWHNAPRRQFVINIAGEVEVGLGDGSVHRFGPGHVTLAEDLTGKGHTTRAVGNQSRTTATIPLADA